MAFPKIWEGSKAKSDFVPFRAKKKGDAKKTPAKGKEKMNAAKMAALKAKKK